jgi:transcriptional regulator with XRE-family HTH domain
MPQVSTHGLADILRRHMREQKLTQQAAAELITVSIPTLSGLLKGKSNPTKVTAEKIEDYLKNVGEMTRLGLPSRPLYTPIDKIDEDALESIGIKPMPKGVPEFDLPKHEPSLTAEDKVRIIKQLDTDLVLKLFPDLL